MASGPLVSSGGGDESREKHRWGENKVYTRKFHKSSGKSNDPATPQNLQVQSQPPASSQQTVATTTEDVNSSIQQPASSPHQHHEQQISSFESAASGDDASSLNDNGRRHNPPSTSNRDAVAPSNNTNHQDANHNNGNHLANSPKEEKEGPSRRLINIASKSRLEVRELRMKLTQELDQVRALVKRLEARELQAAPSAAPASVTGYSQSQLSASNTYNAAGTKRPAGNSEAASAASLRRQLSVSVAPNNSIGEVLEKEKRTPKANQYYRNSEFLLAKDKIPPADSHKKSKSGSNKKHSLSKEDSLTSPSMKKYAQAFKSCSAILSKLMKHKYGWVFNSPVDVKGLGLHDYHIIIKHPMDFGTIKIRLEKSWYKSPREFADDVRLVFRNAMTYNPKGQDVHVMAEQLSAVFEERWPSIEAEYAVLPYQAAAPATTPRAPDMRVLERSGSTISPRAVSYKPQMVRAPAMKKPKAKDPNKRDMTYEEKQKLSTNLQSLPSEKLDSIVQIIKKRTTSLSQHDDEIEVDIDSVDNETLWELDRFVTNYKKSLSKNKRRAELARSLHKPPERVTKPDTIPAAGEPPETRPAGSPSREAEEKNAGTGRSSSSSSSSSDSGTSSSDSDSDSSSAYGSDAAHSP